MKATNWLARIAVGLAGSALILTFGNASVAGVTTSTYSEAHRLQRHYFIPERVVLSARLVTIDLPPPVTTMPHIASPAEATTTTTTTLVPKPVDSYRFYERSPRVTALQMELGMKSVDGVYGPNTRRAHIDSMGGAMSVLIRNYPEIVNGAEQCSHGCLPGDGHYELPTLGELINKYFQPEDRALARRIAYCESSGQPHDIGSAEVSDALAVGWFQHLAKYWATRSERAGWGGYNPFHGEANVAVAAWLYYSSGVHHWNPSKGCWG